MSKKDEVTKWFDDAKETDTARKIEQFSSKYKEYKSFMDISMEYLLKSRLRTIYSTTNSSSYR